MDCQMSDFNCNTLISCLFWTTEYFIKKQILIQGFLPPPVPLHTVVSNVPGHGEKADGVGIPKFSKQNSCSFFNKAFIIHVS